MADFDTSSGVIVNASTSITADTPNESGAYIILTGAAHAGITVNFEGTIDGANWFPVVAYALHTGQLPGVVTSIALGSNSSNQYYAIVGAAKQFRVRSSAYTSGTLQVSITTVVDADPVLPSPTSTAPAAAQDSLTNPTTTQVGADQMVYNGTSWDRMRGNWNVAVDTSAARTTTGNGTTATNYNADGAYIAVNVTAASGTTPTLAVRVQWSFDGTNFVDLDATNATTASITTTGIYVIKVYPGIPTVAAGSCNSVLPRTWRCAWTIGGTTPSFTFTTTAAYVL